MNFEKVNFYGNEIISTEILDDDEYEKFNHFFFFYIENEKTI